MPRKRLTPARPYAHKTQEPRVNGSYKIAKSLEEFLHAQATAEGLNKNQLIERLGLEYMAKIKGPQAAAQASALAITEKQDKDGPNYEAVSAAVRAIITDTNRRGGRPPKRPPISVDEVK